MDIDSGNSSTHSPSPMDPYQSIDTPNSQKQRASPTKCTSTTHREMNEHCKMKSPSLSDGRILIICFYTSLAILRFKLHGYKDISMGIFMGTSQSY